jgi:hypothetical protein
MIEVNGYASIQERIDGGLAVKLVRLNRTSSIDIPIEIAKLSFSAVKSAPDLFKKELIRPSPNEVQKISGRTDQPETEVAPTLDELLDRTKKIVRFSFPNASECNVDPEETMTEEEMRALISFGITLYEKEPENVPVPAIPKEPSTGFYL